MTRRTTYDPVPPAFALSKITETAAFAKRSARKPAGALTIGPLPGVAC
jgi:hypothetical protein